MKYAEINWVDGQPYSQQYHDLYYSTNDGLAETEYVFLQQNNLAERFKGEKKFLVAEAGFGTGLNFIATCRQWLQHSSEDSVLSYVGIEKHPVSPNDIRRVANQWDELGSLFDELLDNYPPAISGSHLVVLFNGRVRLQLEFLDINEALAGRRFVADAWFLDGFSPRHNTEMWSDALIQTIAIHSRIGTSLSTYTAAGHVRRSLDSHGFSVKKVKGHGNKREMITATLNREMPYVSEFPWYEMPRQSCAKKTVIVIGAGLVGLTTSLALVNKGWSVTLIDQYKNVAQEASGNPAAVLLPRMTLGNTIEQNYFVNAFLFAVRTLDVLQKNSDIKFWHKTGVCSQESKNKAEKILDMYPFNEDFVCEEKGFVEYENVGRSNKTGKKLNYPAAGWVSLDKLCQAMFSLIEKKIEYKQAVVEKITRLDGIWRVEDKQAVISSAAVVVMATGKSIAENEISAWLPVNQVRGQITRLDSTKKSQLLSQVESFGRFVTPEYEGVHYTGASYDMDDKSSELNRISQSENAEVLNKQFPGVFSQPDSLTGRVGFRSVSEDRMPLVGLMPNKDWFEKNYGDLHHGRAVKNYPVGQYHDGLYVNGAHGSRGLTTSFLSAEILVSIMETAACPVTIPLLNALNPARFIIRRLKRNQKVS